MTDDNGRNWMSCLGWGCLAVVVLSALGIGGCVAYVYRGSSAARSVTDAYLEAVDAGRYEEAYADLGSRFAEGRNVGDFVAFEQASRAQMGACGDWRMSGTSVNRESGRSVAQLTYQGSCDSGPIEVGFSLEQVDGRWLIEDIRYHEPGLEVIPTCAECGTALPPGARFCPNCGSEIGGEEGAADELEAGDGPLE